MTRDNRYDWLAPLYDATMVLTERGLRRHRQDLLSRARGRVLEVGAGTGASLRFYPEDTRVLAIDTSAAMLRRAARKARQLGLKFVPFLMDAEHLAFPDQSFDTVVSSLVLCSVQDPALALAELRRVLRPGGRALFIEHVRPSGILAPVFDAMNLVWKPVVCDLTRRTESLVSETGFRIVWRKAPVSFLRVIEATIDVAGVSYAAQA